MWSIYYTGAIFGSWITLGIFLGLMLAQLIYVCNQWVHDRPIGSFMYGINESIDRCLTIDCPDDSPCFFLGVCVFGIFAAVLSWLWPISFVVGGVIASLRGLRSLIRLKTKVNQIVDKGM